MKKLHRATIVTVPLKSPYGILDLSAQGTICGFREKPELPFWINAGIYISAISLFSSLRSLTVSTVLQNARL